MLDRLPECIFYLKKSVTFQHSHVSLLEGINELFLKDASDRQGVCIVFKLNKLLYDGVYVHVSHERYNSCC